jgi:hypothetical protein
MPFSGPKLKVQRARQHISDLQGFLNSFFKPADYRFIEETHPETGQYVLKFELLRQVSPDIALLIGDVLHNLRSALDFSYYLAVSKSGGQPTDFSKFLVEETRERLEGPLRGGSIRHSAALQNLILDGIQPYKAGNYMLWALHQLNIIDKHKLLVPVVQATRLVGVDFDAGSNRFRGMSFGIHNGRITDLISGTGEIKIHNYGMPTFEILFERGLPMENQSVIPTLWQFANVVSGVVEKFEDFFKPKDPPTS